MAGWKRNHDSSCFASQNLPFFFAYGRVKKSFQWSWAGWPLCITSSESCETTFGDPLLRWQHSSPVFSTDLNKWVGLQKWDPEICLLKCPQKWMFRLVTQTFWPLLNHSTHSTLYIRNFLDWHPRIGKNITGSKVESFNLHVLSDVTGII